MMRTFYFILVKLLVMSIRYLKCAIMKDNRHIRCNFCKYCAVLKVAKFLPEALLINLRDLLLEVNVANAVIFAR